MMNRGLQALTRAFPDRRSFSDEEVSMSNRILDAYVAFAREDSRNVLPDRYAEVGGAIEVQGHRYMCVLRPDGLVPSEACSGCDFSRKYRSCASVQCSSFDREDRRCVWYVEEQG